MTEERRTFNADKIYQHFKRTPTKYNEELHCPMLLELMADRNKATMSSFCVKAMISEGTFWNWIRAHELFSQVWDFGKMMAREIWEADGRELRDLTYPIGTISYTFEHWKLIGWSRFGISKNSRIKLDLNPSDNPNQHYAQLLAQASKGDFTAGEIKQLMEAVNVGLNTHQVFKLQAEIDQLKSDLETMGKNNNVHNPSSD